jgi:branched-chain amino acid transport system ATP-binding protein
VTGSGKSAAGGEQRHLNRGETPSALLEVENASVSFGGLRALSNVSLTAREGRITGLIGPNGAGKTTLFNVITGIHRASAGVIRLDGRDISALRAERRAKLGIARSFQNLGLMTEEKVELNLMAAQYLSAGYPAWHIALRPRHWSRQEQRVRSQAWQVAEEFGLADCWTTRVGDLSFGRARFVELACVLMQQPRLMLFDEPTTGLDAAETEALTEMLDRQRSAGATILVVAHDVRFVMELCDHIFVLAQGKSLFDGPPTAVQAHPEVIQCYLGRAHE